MNPDPSFIEAVKSGLTNNALKERFSNLSVRTLQRYAKSIRDAQHRDLPKATESTLEQICSNVNPLTEHKWGIPESTEPDCTQWVRLEEIGAIGLISDLHIPFHHAETLETFLTACRDAGAKRFVLLGDTFDGGHWHPKRGKEQHHGRRWQDDLEVAKKIFKVFLTCFEGGDVFMGNHDDWHQAHYRGQVDASYYFSHIFHDFPQIRFSDYQQMDVVSGGRVFKLLHGANYSGANPLGVGQRLSEKFECGIVMGHQHHACDGFSRSGRQVVCIGGAHDDTKFGYVHHSPKTNPCMTRSFAILKDGWCTHHPMPY